MTKREDDKKNRKLLEKLILGPVSEQTIPMSREDWLRAVVGDIDPLKHAGESWFATEEYARPKDINDIYVRSQIGREGDYYPESYARKRKK